MYCVSDKRPFTMHHQVVTIPSYDWASQLIVLPTPKANSNFATLRLRQPVLSELRAGRGPGLRLVRLARLAAAFCSPELTNSFIKTSLLGSIGSCTKDTAALFTQFGYGYTSSKAALNMITRLLAVELRESNIVAVSLHPGYVDTDMTEGKATLKPSDSVAAMTDLITKLTPESTGKFFNLDPQTPVSELPW
ncbi:hypothetical protein KRP22_002687 [Phytophthora ramorum]|nr:C-factor [Phytophthora ramorum]KAH7503281.1 C-factor [Phytophthora ramorum]